LICHFIRKRDAPGEPRNADGKRPRYDPNVSSLFLWCILDGHEKKKSCYSTLTFLVDYLNCNTRSA